MPRTCTVCTHPKRSEIDKALLAGDSYRHIASRFDTSTAALQRHKKDHLSEQMARVAERNEQADIRTAIDVVAQLKAINGVTLSVLQDARAAGDGALTLQATDRILKQIELQARLIDLIGDGDTINIVVNPAWVEMRTLLFGALVQHPEARLAVAEALRSIEAGDHANAA